MPNLDPAEVNAVKRYLGYDLITADAWRGDAAAGLDRNLERLDDDGVVSVRAVLTELAAIDTSITAARGRLKATQVGNLQMNARGELQALRKERTEVSRELARLLGVCPPAFGGGHSQVTV